jgi:phytoene/squalene synthetase
VDRTAILARLTGHARDRRTLAQRDLVAPVRDRPFGAWTVPALELVTTDKVMSAAATVLHARLALPDFAP